MTMMAWWYGWLPDLQLTKQFSRKPIMMALRELVAMRVTVIHLRRDH